MRERPRQQQHYDQFNVLRKAVDRAKFIHERERMANQPMERMPIRTVNSLEVKNSPLRPERLVSVKSRPQSSQADSEPIDQTVADTKEAKDVNAATTEPNETPADPATNDNGSAVWWIGGGLLLVVLAIGVAKVVKSKSNNP